MLACDDAVIEKCGTCGTKITERALDCWHVRLSLSFYAYSIDIVVFERVVERIA